MLRGGGLASDGVPSDRLMGGGSVSVTVDFGSSGRAEAVLASVDLSQTATILLDILDPDTRSPQHPQTMITRQFGVQRQTVVIRDVMPGPHLLRLCLQDGAGTNLLIDEELAGVAAGQVTSVTFDTSEADQPPSVVFTAPTEGQNVTGFVTLKADATDDVSVAQVEFFADNVSLGVDSAAPYEQSWNTTTLPDGLHSLRVEARDSAGQPATPQTIQVTVQKAYVFSRTWGSLGNGPLQFYYPHGIAADRTNGFIYVSDTGNYLIKKYLPDGTHLATFGGLLGVRGIAVTRTGNVVAGDSSAVVHRALELDGTSGVVVNSWGSKGSGDGQFDFPVGVAASASRDEVYVLDYHNQRVQAFALVGGAWTFDHKWGSSGSGPGQFFNPEGITVDSDENVYVADSANNRVQKFAPDGTPLTIFGTSGPGTLNNPYAVSWYQGSVYVADTYNHRVVVFSPGP